MTGPWGWAVCALAAAAAAAGAWWLAAFRRLLPLEAGLARERASAQALADFAGELLGSHRLPSNPQLLADILRQGLDRLAVRVPSAGLAVWCARPDAAPEFVHRAGALAGLDAALLDVPGETWESAFPAGGRAADPGGEPVPAGLRGALAGLGLGRARLVPWGLRSSVRGLLLSAAADGRGLEPAWRGAGILAAHFDSIADMAASLWELHRTRQRLEGGLSTLHEVASAVAGHQETPADAMNAVVSIVARTLDADLCAFLLYDEATGELATQPGAYGLAGDEAFYRLPVTNQQSSSVRVFLTGVPFMTGDAQADPRVILRYAKLWRCHSLAVVPLTIEGRRLGVMRVGSFKKDFFTADHLTLLDLVAEEAVVLLESVLLNRRLADANRRLSDINRMKDDFVSTVSHEFKTPLTAIKGFLSVVLDGELGPLTPEQAKFVGIAKAAADRLTLLVSDLLDLSRLESGVTLDLAPVDLGRLAEACRLEHQHQAERRSIELRVCLPARLPPVRGDSRWLRQVLDNLVSNAIKFTPPGGAVSISGADQGESVQLSVEDTGVGIRPEDAVRVFEKFYRVRRGETETAPGTGLGLAIAKHIVDKHEGRIWVESEPGKGSRFKVALPVDRTVPGPAGGLEPPGREEAGRPPAAGGQRGPADAGTGRNTARDAVSNIE